MAPGVQTGHHQGQEEKLPSYDVKVPYKPADNGTAHNRTEFPEYLPSWDDKNFHDDPLAFDYQDPASRAAADMPNLLYAGAGTRDITPKMGTILTGVNLKGLSDAAKDELALLVTKRKVVVLRDQLEFLTAGPGYQQKLMERYGVPNIQPVTGPVKGHFSVSM